MRLQAWFTHGHTSLSPSVCFSFLVSYYTHICRYNSFLTGAQACSTMQTEFLNSRNQDMFLHTPMITRNCSALQNTQAGITWQATSFGTPETGTLLKRSEATSTQPSEACRGRAAQQMLLGFPFSSNEVKFFRSHESH